MSLNTQIYLHYLQIYLIILTLKTDRKKISVILKNELPKLQDDYSVATMEIFGSYVRNEQKLDSDLDIIVSFTVPPGLFKFIKLENHLSDLLGIKVDLVMRSALKPTIGKRIISEAQTI